MSSSRSAVLRTNSRIGLLIALTALTLFITGSFISIDWFNTATGSASLYPAYAKPVVSVLCAAVAFAAARANLGRGDFRFVVWSFICIVIVDICMSIYVYSDNTALTSVTFLIGAALSILAHVLLILRHAKGFQFLRGKDSLINKLWLPLVCFVPVLIIFIILIPYLNAVGQFWPSLIYALIITTSLWVAWETVRRRLFPRPNALLIALGVTSWFITELVGVVHNIEIGRLSDIAMNLTWHFYMPAILLIALSAHRWKSAKT